MTRGISVEDAVLNLMGIRGHLQLAAFGYPITAEHARYLAEQMHHSIDIVNQALGKVEKSKE